jgi:hypothetical protein
LWILLTLHNNSFDLFTYITYVYSSCLNRDKSKYHIGHGSHLNYLCDQFGNILVSIFLFSLFHCFYSIGTCTLSSSPKSSAVGSYDWPPETLSVFFVFQNATTIAMKKMVSYVEQCLLKGNFLQCIYCSTPVCLTTFCLTTFHLTTFHLTMFRLKHH